MSYIKKFVDKIGVMEGRQAREVILPISDAKGLRDEVLKILLDQREQKNTQPEVIEVVMNGNKW
jgi:hypothetical protein